MAATICLDCQSQIYILNPEIGLQVQCQHCKNIFEVTWLYPLCIDFPEEPVLQMTSPEVINKLENG